MCQRRPSIFHSQRTTTSASLSDRPCPASMSSRILLIGPSNSVPKSLLHCTQSGRVAWWAGTRLSGIHRIEVLSVPVRLMSHLGNGCSLFFAFVREPHPTQRSLNWRRCFTDGIGLTPKLSDRPRLSQARRAQRAGDGRKVEMVADSLQRHVRGHPFKPKDSLSCCFASSTVISSVAAPPTVASFPRTFFQMA